MDQRIANLGGLQRRPVAAWREAGYWGQSPLWQRVRDAAATNGERLAVVDDTGHLTARRLWRNALSVAAALRRDGVGKGDMVLVQLPNWREFPVLAVAIEACGAVLGFCPASWGVRETARALDLLQPKVWFVAARGEALPHGFVDHCLAEAAAAPKVIGVRYVGDDAVASFDTWHAGVDVAAFDPDHEGGNGLDPLEVAVTSGTTGAPKGVLHVHDSALATVQSTIIRQQIGPADRILVGIPVGHTFGYFYGVRCALQSGALLVLQERWNATRASELVDKWHITVALGPAACIIDLLSLPAEQIARLEPLRLFTQSGDALPRPVAARAAELLPCRISRALGMTEFGHVASTDAGSPFERILDSAGSPQPGIVIEVRDAAGQVLPRGEAGRVFVAGPALFSGYLHADRLDQDVLDAGGFFETGDLGWLGEDGYLHITGREKNIIRRGAVTIPTAAVEEAIASHPEVAHAVVIARSDLRLGEVPVACVQMQAGRPAMALDTLKVYLEGLGMTRNFWPEDIFIVQEWPIGPTAKIDRAALLAQILKARPEP